MDFYDGGVLNILIDGLPVECLNDLTLSESMSLEAAARGAFGWDGIRPNLQEYNIDVSGFDDGGFVFLRDLKRQYVLVQWQITTPDGNIDLSGSAYVVSVSRDSPFDDDNTFSATLTGFGPINEGLSTSFRVLEDGDLRLLEDGDARLLENA